MSSLVRAGEWKGAYKMWSSAPAVESSTTVSAALVKVLQAKKKDRPLCFNCKKLCCQRDEICVYCHPPHRRDHQKCESNAVVKENHRASHAPPRSREKPLATGWSDTSNKTSLADKSVELCTVQRAVLDKSRTRAYAKQTAPLVVSLDKETWRTEKSQFATM